ncbi:MAG: ATP-binding protein [Bacteroidia bacterium]|nr:ATP-binding protein [Bacteroidia bacterium]MDW8158056.1 ATP-binding protein [Bacteroidia bacterium]
MFIYSNKSIEIQAQPQEKKEIRIFELLSPYLRPKSGQSLSEWGDYFLQQLVPLCNCLQGALYLYTQEPKKGLALLSTYAVSNAEKREFIVEREGLLGEAIWQKKTVYIESEYGFQSRARSGLAWFHPQAVLLLPLIYEEFKVGILELTSLYPLAKELRNSLQEVARNIAINMRLNLLQEEMTQRLEAQVEARTQDLKNALESLRQTQDSLIKSEKMAVLGQLIAGVAHEINTPIGAIKAGATNVVDILPLLLKSTNTLLSTLDEKTQNLIETFQKDLLKKTEVLTSKEERKLRRAYLQELEALNLLQADEFADRLIEAGFIGELAPYYPLFKHEKANEIIELINLQGQVIKNMKNIILAAEKTKKIVFSLRSYSHTTTTDEMQLTDVAALLEVVFTIFNNQFKQGIKLFTELDNLPMIKAYPDELSQVFINIIQNAIHAMQGVGELHIAGKVEGERLILSFRDTGPGIPAHLINKIFEPFFTTKKQGEGTGLGLDICKKIIEKHKGKIYVDSEPGKTIFFIELPLE